MARKVWTKARKAAAARVLKAARTRLGLSHFDFIVDFHEDVGDETPEGLRTVAEVRVSENYVTAAFDLYADFVNADEGEQYKHAIHEWMHVVVAPLERWAVRAVPPYQHEDYERDLERVVESLAKIVAYGSS